MRHCAILLATLCVFAPHATPLYAQEPATATRRFPDRAFVTSHSISSTEGAPPGQNTSAFRNPDLAFAASLIVPGSGQYMLKQGRWVPYLALETWAWIQYRDHKRESRRLAADYRDLAWSIARRVSTGERRDTSFAYYEALTHFVASGAFDARPDVEGLQPEENDVTYNGGEWMLARQLFIPEGTPAQPGSPQYEAALDYYRAHAIPDAFAFAWNTGLLEQQVYTDVINRSDAAYRDATRLLGIILANHLTSAVDALISARLRAGGTNVKLESGFSPEPSRPGGPATLRFDATLRVTW